MNTNETEEFISKIKEAGLDWKTVAQIAAALKAKEENKSIETQTTIQTTNSITYEVQISYPDLILIKTKGASTSRAVICVSQNSYYVQTAKKITPLSATVWADFATGMEPINLKDYWIPKLVSGQRFFKSIERLLADDDIREAIQRKAYPLDVAECIGANLESRSEWSTNNIFHMYQNEADLYADLKPIYKDLCESQCRNNNLFLGSLYYIFCKYGIEKARDFITSCDRSLMVWDKSIRTACEGLSYQYFYAPAAMQGTAREKFYRFMQLSTPFYAEGRCAFYLPLIEMEYEKLRDYILYDSYRMGYSSLVDFLRDWTDTLNSQEAAFGKIKEKYPVHLREYHDIAARTARLIEQARETEGFIEHATEIRDRFKATIDGYMFMVPQGPEDMLDEATQQANCLAGYVSKFAEGNTNIIFMRRADAPEVSVVTIEVIGDNITQAYAANNRIPSIECREVIRKYAKKIGVTYTH